MPLRPCCVRALCMLCLAIFFCDRAVAQVSTASVTGIVEDSTGARIANADIKLINTQTGSENDAETNHYGIFLLPGILPGGYSLEIDRYGFATVQIAGLMVNVGETKDLIVRMRPGSVRQTVNINAGGITLNTSDASVSTVVDRKFVANLPLNGRSFQDLISMTPGILTESPQAFGEPNAAHGDFSVNGQRPDTNSYTVDGVSADVGIGLLAGHQKIPSYGNAAGTTALGTTQSLVSVDALQEFRVLGSSYSAEYGHTPGGQFSLLTRSGESTLHGTAYDYVRNFAADSKDWFTRYNNAGQGITYQQNDVGGTLGGPLRFSDRMRKARTFFFSSGEALRVNEPIAPTIQYMPTVGLWGNVPSPVENVLSAAYGYYVYPVATPVGSGLSPFVPWYSNYTPSSANTVSFRIDRDFISGDSAFFRYDFAPSDSQSETPWTLATNHLDTQTITLGAIVQISSKASDDIRLGYASSNSSISTKSTVYPGFGPDLNESLGLPDTGATADVFIHIPGIGNSEVNANDAAASLGQWDVRDTVTAQAAHHLLRSGMEERRINSAVTPPPLSVEADFFDLSSLLLNRATDISITRSLPAQLVFNEFSAFIQDQWRLSPSLTLSPGLRWEVDPPPHGQNGQDAWTVLGTLASPAALQLAPHGTPLWKTSWFNVAPRLGAAWVVRRTPGREVVLRAGGGVFFDTDNRAAAQAFTALGFSATVHPDDVPVPVTPQLLDFAVDSEVPFTRTTVFAFPRHLQLPFAVQWNVTAEKALSNYQTLTASWVAAAGRRLLTERRADIHSENPEFDEINFFPGGVASNYQALQLKLQRSVYPGVQFLAAYSWSHTLDYGSIDPVWPLTRGNSDFDVRQNLEAAVSWNQHHLSGNALRKYILSGWGLDGRLTARSAFPVTLLGNIFSDPATGNRYYSGGDRIPGRPLYIYGSQYPGGRIFNGGPDVADPAFTLPKGVEAGDAPRNSLRGFGDEQVNVALRREIPLGEDWGIQLRAETYNLFNHPDFGYIDPALTDALFGQAILSLNQSFGPTGSLYEPGGPRSVQLALRLHF